MLQLKMAGKEEEPLPSTASPLRRPADIAAPLDRLRLPELTEAPLPVVPGGYPVVQTSGARSRRG
jgi:hypothetical protein